MVVSIFAVWADRQVFDANNWGDTSEEMLQNPDVRDQVSQLMVDTVYANVDVATTLGQQLPPALQPLAAPIAGGLRQLAERATEHTLQRPRVQEAWKQANILTAKQFIAIAENKQNATITAQGNAVILDLRGARSSSSVERLGLPGKVVGQIPPDAGKVKIMSADQVGALQDATRILSGCATWLPPLAIALFALAVYLARGRRRAALMYVGVDLIAAGVLVLLIRSVAGDSVVSSLAASPSVAARRPCGVVDRHADTSGRRRRVHHRRHPRRHLSISRRPSAPRSGAAQVGGAVAARAARARLRTAEPADRTDPVVVPIPATRKPIPVLLLIVLAIVGMQALRRQVAEEQGTTLAAAADPADQRRHLTFSK